MVPTSSGKPAKMKVYFPVRGRSRNFEHYGKIGILAKYFYLSNKTLKKVRVVQVSEKSGKFVQSEKVGNMVSLSNSKANVLVKYFLLHRILMRLDL